MTFDFVAFKRAIEGRTLDFGRVITKMTPCGLTGTKPHAPNLMTGLHFHRAYALS